MFENEFAKIEYIEKDNVVFHVWKKECHFDGIVNISSVPKYPKFI